MTQLPAGHHLPAPAAISSQGSVAGEMSHTVSQDAAHGPGPAVDLHGAGGHGAASNGTNGKTHDLRHVVYAQEHEAPQVDGIQSGNGVSNGSNGVNGAHANGVSNGTNGSNGNLHEQGEPELLVVQPTARRTKRTMKADPVS